MLTSSELQTSSELSPIVLPVTKIPAHTRLAMEIDQLVARIKDLFKIRDTIEGVEESISFYVNEISPLVEEVGQLSAQRKLAKKKAIDYLAMQEQIRDIDNSRRDARFSDTTKQYVMLTINPSEKKCTPQQLVNVVKCFMNQRGTVDYGVYAFEQRGEVEDDYQGFHVHMFFKRGAYPSRLVPAIHNAFDCLVGDPRMGSYAIYMKTDDDVNQFRSYYQQYIQGVKKDPKKKLKCENDKRMRKAYSLADMYTVGDIPPLLLGMSPKGMDASN